MKKESFSAFRLPGIQKRKNGFTLAIQFIRIRISNLITGYTGQTRHRTGTGCAPIVIQPILKRTMILYRDTFKTTWSEIDVSCEACHGPASAHIEWANLPEGSRPMDINTGLIVKTRNLDNKELLNVCARCHSRRAIMGDYENNNDDLLNYMIPQLITQPIYHADGQILDEDYEYASFTQSKMFEKAD